MGGAEAENEGSLADAVLFREVAGAVEGSDAFAFGVNGLENTVTEDVAVLLTVLREEILVGVEAKLAEAEAG